MSELQNKTLTGLFWSSVDTYGVFMIKLGFSVAIARLLEPEDYGLIGMIAIFIAFGSMFADGGFFEALIQKKEPTDKDFSSVFYYQMTISIIFYFALFLSADAIANFYDEERVIPIVKVMGLSAVVSALGSIHVARYIKLMEFKSYAKISTTSSLFSGVTGLTMAFYGFGVWALVMQSLAGNFLNTLLYWILNKWKPKLVFSMGSMKQLFSFGWKMFLQRLLQTVFSNIYYPIIGKWFDVTVLGYYTRARKFQEIAVLQTQISINKVLFPAFSSIQDNEVKFKNAARRSFQILGLFVFLLIIVLIVTARPFVLFFLTEKWIMLVPYMQLLYLHGFIVPFIIFNNNIVNSLGRSDISLKINIFSKLFLFVAIVGGIYFGIFGLIVGQLISSIIVYFITAHICGKKMGFELKKQLKTLFPVIGIATAAFIPGYLLEILFSLNPLLLMILQLFVVVIVYYSLARLLKLQSYLEFKALVKDHIPNRFKFLL